MYYIFGTTFTTERLNSSAIGHSFYKCANEDRTRFSSLEEAVDFIRDWSKEDRYFMLVEVSTGKINLYHKGYLLFADIE